MPRTLLTVLLALLFGVGLVAPSGASAAQGGAQECEDFETQEEAQEVLDEAVDEDDDDQIDELDPDGDGDACERLPTEDELAEEEAEDEPADEEDAEDEDAEDEEAEDEPAEDEDEAADEDEDEPADEEEAEDGGDQPSGNPLNARLGGNRDGFEAEYGEPADDEPAGDYPLGFDYEVEGVGNVNVFFHNEKYIAYLTVELEDPVAPRRALREVEDFLPADYEAEDETETDDGDLLLPAFSTALEDRYSEATYEKYGAPGDVGTFYVLSLLDRDGDVDTIEIGLGDDVQSPPEDEEPQDEAEDEPQDEPEDEDPADEPAEGEELTEDDIAFAANVRAEFDVVAASMDAFQQGFADFDAGTITAQELGGIFATSFATWRQADANAQGLAPSPALESLTEIYVEFTGTLTDAADTIEAGLANQDQAGLQAGLETYNGAAAVRILIDSLLSGYGV